MDADLLLLAAAVVYRKVGCRCFCRYFFSPCVIAFATRDHSSRARANKMRKPFAPPLSDGALDAMCYTVQRAKAKKMCLISDLRIAPISWCTMSRSVHVVKCVHLNSIPLSM